MLDIKYIIENKPLIQEGLDKKGYGKIISLDELEKLYLEMNKLKTSSQAKSEEKNKLSNAIKSASAEERPAIIAKSKEIGEELKKELEELDAVKAKFDEIMLRMPNMPSPQSPVGPDDSANVVRRKVGEPRKFEFTPRDHVELMELNDWSEMERIAKVSGARTYAIKNELAKLELAIHMMVLDKLADHGFTTITVPSISKEKPLYGQGYLPFSRDEIYYMPADDIYLSGTAELILNSLRADEILNENELPILYAGFSPCFRREAGAAGKDTRGLTRVHQFMKTEQFVICKNDINESEKWHQKLLAISEEVLQDLELPYQVLEVCTGDMGAPKYRQYDLEAWVPTQDCYRETHSCSNITEWQARRTNLRYRDNADGKVKFVHTLNNTGVATPRVLVPLLENHQNADGTVNIPAKLQPYMGGKTVIGKGKTA
ncbi:MAG: serine--tRNA ligase [Alphaproteobacteria bacterium]|nr:serine--tRNA ligase [Alphaproteobacteria bacterium]MBQ8631312.1 serine--tRNA ligase [Alphaproteobacteria bacterium]